MLTALGALWLLSCGSPPPTCDRTITWSAPGEDPVTTCARVATRDDERRRGLRGAPQLAPTEGLWLQYPVVSRACIGMEGMAQPLDVHFVGADGRVLRSACALSPDAEAVCQGGTQAVLERAPHPSCGAWRGSFLGEPTSSSGWLAAPSPVLPACDERGDATVDGLVMLDVVRHPDVPDATLRRILGGASRWWGERGLWLSLAGEPRTEPVAPVLTGLRREMKEMLLAEGLPWEGGTPEEQEAVRQKVVDYVTAPLKAELAARAVPYRKHTVVVVVLPEIGAPGTLAEALFERLRGLTFSPWLRDRVGPDERLLYDALELPERFVPVVFVGTEPLNELGPEIDVTLAHELGHALGLPHEASSLDLMADAVHRCEPGLSAVQAKQLMGYQRLGPDAR